MMSHNDVEVIAPDGAALQICDDPTLVGRRPMVVMMMMTRQDDAM